ncbi:sensor histidine kinase [Cohnella terricola]|uniref:histidine kinase n=1 Tax=Cohnella terricola TaxID=1289167 RepID=A0A559JQU4_9BACL|nr:HAMP domain-containing sensor histidine kinase [Cohnella terricola]TVY02249.1 HAMP domain-containing histidine kinase [Cohnella terricola]
MSKAHALFGSVRRVLFPRSLRYQLLSRILLILAVLLVVIGLFQYYFMERFIYQNRAASIQRQIQSVPGELWGRLHSPLRRVSGDAFIFFPSSSVAFYDKQGAFTVLSTMNAETAESVPRLNEQEYAEAFARQRKDRGIYKVVRTGAGGEQLVVLQSVRSFQGTVGVVQVSMNTKPLRAELIRQFMLYLALALAALIAGLLVFLPAIRRTLTPLSRMVATVERIDSGKLNERLPEPTQPMEIDRLSHSFNRMLERLETSFRAEQEGKERMRRFVSDASHELRTPLTSIYGFLEVLLRGAASDPVQLDRALRSMRGESERINKLVNDLLQLAKLDRAPEARLATCDLSRIVQEMEPQLKLLAQSREVSLDLRQVPELQLDPDKIKQIVLNLFQNAVQHTDAREGRIRISVAKDDQGVEIAVADNGEGIAEEHLPKLFERFYRIDLSRTRKYGGAGLGLSITLALVEWLGGKISAESRLGEGSTFRVTFPYTA